MTGAWAALRDAEAVRGTVQAQEAGQRPTGRTMTMSSTIRAELRVWLVDDDRTGADGISREIREMALNASVDVVRDLDRALSALADDPSPPHLVVVAGRGTASEAALRRVAAEPALRGVPLVVAARQGTTLDVARAIELGADGYVSTTSHRHDLWALLANTELYWSARPRALGQESPRRVGDRTVLVVEPEVRDARLLARALDRQGFPPPVIVTSGEDAVRWIGEHHADLCLLAYRLPGIDGIETLIGIRQRQPELPVLMVSDVGSERAAVLAFRAGVVDYIPKATGFEQEAAGLARRIVETPADGGLSRSALTDASIPVELLRLTYQNRLRVIGRQLDVFGHGSVQIVEVAGGFMVRGTVPGARTPESLVFLDRDLPVIVAAQFAARQRSRERAGQLPPLLPTGYQDFLRALGHRLDRHQAAAVTITQMADFFVVRAVHPMGSEARRSLDPIRWRLRQEDIAELLDEARRRRA